MNFYHPLWAEVNLDSLQYNIKNIMNSASKSEVIGIVKANAYGHGAIEVSKKIIECGINTVAVANIDEAIELRENNIDCNIMILGVTEEKAINKLLEYNIEPTITTYEFALSLSSKALINGKKAKAHIGLDTGMGRIGFIANEENMEKIISITEMEGIDVISLFSHFSDADGENKDYVKKQLAKYNLFKNRILEKMDKTLKLNIANSAAILDVPSAHYDYVRAGIIQYGYYPSQYVDKENIKIKPVLTWKSKITHLKIVEKDEYIGYGRTFKTNRRTTIATIPVGYADGYYRSLSGKSYMLVKDNLAPVIGRVCMDQCMIDVTDIGDIQIGDEVIILGSYKNKKFDADDIADISDTINYECLCSIGRRVPRIYIENNEVIKVRKYM